jgi:type II secretory ATPase GspE/PulE/Tfp pilus assembly ATPase PilB-like protein
LRISTIPTGYGEGVVMRILRQDMQQLNIKQLGFSPHNLDLIEKFIRKHMV